MIIFDNKSQRLIFSGLLKFFDILLCPNMEYQKPKTYYQSKTNFIHGTYNRMKLDVYDNKKFIGKIDCEFMVPLNMVWNNKDEENLCICLHLQL